MHNDVAARHTMRASSNAVVVGGGIIGLATAYELQRRGVRTTVVEGNAVAAGQSGRNWGFVRQQGRSPQELPMVRAANQRWQNLEDEIGANFNWVQGGNLALATHARAQRYHAWAELGRSHGLDTRLAGPADIEKLVPGMRLPHTAAIYTSTDGHADPVAATRALAHAAEHAGATIHTESPVRRFETRRGRVCGVRTEHRVLDADVVICAAGAASRWLLRTAGIRIPQNIVRGTVALTEPVAPLARTTVWAPGLAFRQRPDGRIVITTGGGGDIDITLDTLLQAPLFLPGLRHNFRQFRLRLRPTAVLSDLQRRMTGHTTTTEPPPTLASAEQALLRLRAALPTLSNIRLERAWAGLIDTTPDGLAILDRTATPAGMVIGTGFSGHGFGLAPAAGEVLAALATDTDPGFDITPFRLSRFAERDFQPPQAIL